MSLNQLIAFLFQFGIPHHGHPGWRGSQSQCCGHLGHAVLGVLANLDLSHLTLTYQFVQLPHTQPQRVA
ncbi:MAG: hypothetical protein OTJ44_09095 [Planctomycetota bacterium]|nr:hypothetical protein [Planctomycetota bacterium]